MTHEDVYASLTPIFRSILDDEELKLRPDLRAKDVPSWDSANHIALFLAIEEELTVAFTTEEVVSIRDVGELVKAIVAKRGSAAPAGSAPRG